MSGLENQHISTQRLSITGLGLVTPLGLSAWETFAALLKGRTIADRCNPASQPHNPTNHAPDPVELVRSVGCVSNAQHIGCDPTITLAEQAARQAMFEARVEPGQVTCVLAVSKGAVNHWEKVRNDPLRIALGPLGYLAHQLEQRLGVRVRRTIIASCASGLTALHLARLTMLDNNSSNRPKRVLVVSTEACLSPVFIHSYRRLGVLAELTRQGYRGRPMDQRRAGFMLAEQAAAVVLEREEAGSEDNTDHSGTIELVDTDAASEGFDLVQPASEMPALARIVEQMIRDRAIDVIHPHATGTVENDEEELRVYERVLAGPGSGVRGLGTGKDDGRCSFGQDPGPQTLDPMIYACKGAIGHGLGAAGLAALVIACLCARSGKVPPMPWLEQPMKSGLRIERGGAQLKPNSTHGVFSMGFGGHVAGAVIMKH